MWFSVDSDDDSQDGENAGLFMGCFNQNPKYIASWLPRPQTPVQFLQNNQKYIENDDSEQNSLIFRNNFDSRTMEISVPSS